MAVVQVFRKNRTVSLEVELRRFEPLISAVHSLHDSLQEVSRACTNPALSRYPSRLLHSCYTQSTSGRTRTGEEKHLVLVGARL